MKVLLIVPPIRLNAKPSNPPIGLANIAQAIIDAGHEVSVMDIQAHRWPPNEVINKLSEYDYDVCGIGGLISIYNYVKFLASEIKKVRPEIPIILGGSVSSSIPNLILKNTLVDVAVIGEGEQTITELLEVYENKKDMSAVDGIFYKDNGKIISNKPRKRLPSDQIKPMPAWDLFDIEAYLKNAPSEFKQGSRKRCQAVITSRGCPSQCTFCHRNFGMKLTFRNLDHVMNEIKYFNQKYGCYEFSFPDELFISTLKRATAFADKMKEANLKIKFKCSARGSTLTESIIEKLVDVGLYKVNLGFESGSQTMLDLMKKGTTVEQYKKVISIIRKYKLEEQYTFIFGMPGESPETIRETTDFIKDNNIDPIKGFCLFVATPYPGTELYDEAIKRGLIKDEEKYISQLDDATKFLINFTRMGEKEFLERNRKMKNELQFGYYFRNKLYKRFIADSVRYIRKSGIKKIMVRSGISKIYE